VVWRRSIEEIVEPETVFSAAFAKVFSGTFNTVELRLHGAADLDALVDVIERVKRTNKDIDVDYDEDENIATCVIRMKGHAPIHVTAKTFSLVQPKPAAPKQLVESLFRAQLALTQTYNVLSIPFEAPAAPKLAGPSRS
jgi:hypothetical protein